MDFPNVASLASKAVLAISILLGAIFLRCLVVVIYRLMFHPLARFPGPWLAKISDIWPAWYSLKGDFHLKVQQAHERYGPMVRLGPNKLSVNSVTGLHEIYRKDHVQKSKSYETMLPVPGAYNTHTARDKAIHRRKRKVVNQAFSEQAMRAFEPTMVRNIDVFINQIWKHCRPNRNTDGWSQPLDMGTLTQYLALDIMGEFGFGRSFDMQTKETNRYVIKLIKVTTLVAGSFSQYPRLKDLNIEEWVKKGTYAPAKFGMLMNEMVRKRIAQEAYASQDLFSFIINAKDPETGQGFTLEEIWAESRLFIIAGSDTSTTAMAATFFYLSRNPECKEKLTRTIRETFSSADEISTGPKLSSCRYLRACIDEAMRMSPPIGTALWREVCKEGIVIDGQYIPAGVDVGSSLYSIHHIEEVFEDPWKYNPDRWMSPLDSEKSDEGQDRMQRQAFNPFSLGSRKCIAQTMAYNEISITLAKTLWYFDFRVPTGPLAKVGAGVEGDRKGRHRPGEFQTQEHLTSHYEGPYLEFSVRQGLEDVSM